MTTEGVKQEKPVHVKPAFYSYCYEQLKVIAKEHGYNLLLHGSMNRDLDLVAIPWVDDPKPEVELVVAMDKHLRGVSYAEGHELDGYMFSVLPGGRNNYVINLNRGGRWNQYVDEQWYLDISFTPLCKSVRLPEIE